MAFPYPQGDRQHILHIFMAHKAPWNSWIPHKMSALHIFPVISANLMKDWWKKSQQLHVIPTSLSDPRKALETSRSQKFGKWKPAKILKLNTDQLYLLLKARMKSGCKIAEYRWKFIEVWKGIDDPQLLFVDHCGRKNKDNVNVKSS